MVKRLALVVIPLIFMLYGCKSNPVSGGSGDGWKVVSRVSSSGATCLFSSGNYLFAGVYDTTGVYRSADNGATWSASGNGISTRVTAFAGNENSLFALAPYGGVFRSQDNGASWIRTGTGIPDTAIMAGIAATSNAILALTEDDYSGIFRLYRSLDNGLSWTRSMSGIPDSAQIYCLAASGTTLYAGSNRGNYRSSDNGASWSLIPGLNSIYFQTISVCGSKIFGSDGNFIYSTPLDGNVWTLNDLSPNNMFGQSFFLYTGNDLFFATRSVSLSKDLGDTWTTLNNGFTLTSPIAGIVSSGGYIIIAGNDGMVQRIPIAGL